MQLARKGVFLTQHQENSSRDDDSMVFDGYFLHNLHGQNGFSVTVFYLRFKSFPAFSDKKQQPFPTKNEKNNNNNTAQSLPHQD